MAVGHVKRGKDQTISKTVLITGATGFAGSFLVEAYAARGWEVHGTYKDPIEDRSWVPASVTLHDVDLTMDSAVADLIGSVRPRVIHHLAAQSSVRTAWADPTRTLVANAAMQRNVLEGAAANGADSRVIVVGSCDEYGDVQPEDNPVKETQELRPVNPYALSKVVQDLMGYEYAAARGQDVVRVRPFMQIGPRRQSHFVSGSFARQIAEIEAGLRDSVMTVGNLDLRRDFLDVRDVAEAYALIAEYGATGSVYNIASGVPHSLRELLDAMLSASSAEIEVRQEEGLLRQAEPPLLTGDPTRLVDATGWKWERRFEQAAEDTLNYWRERVSAGLVLQGERK